MDLQRLRRETALDHERVEQLIPLMQPDLTVQQYADVLTRLYGLVQGWDDWAVSRAPRDLRPAVLSRCRGRWLAHDLAYLGVPLPDLRVSPSLSEPVSRSAFLGAMYVMEGSTLGGQYIARHVEGVLQLNRGRGDQYFRGHGARTGAMWREFQVILQSVDAADEDTLIAAARGTFNRFGSWMQGLCDGGVPPPEVCTTEHHA